MIVTPFFPALRAQLAAQGQRACHNLRQLDFPPLMQQLRQLLPPELLAGADEGPNCRDRVFSFRLTLECFLWQLLKPRTACREVVRAVQALFHAEGQGRVAEGTSAYVQARQRLPLERLEKALAHTALTADRRVGGQWTLVPMWCGFYKTPAEMTTFSDGAGSASLFDHRLLAGIFAANRVSTNLQE